VQHPRAYRWSRLLVFGFAHAELLSVVKGKPEGVAKGGERSLRSIGLGTFERKLVSLSWVGGLAFPGSSEPPL
jgi:hypothetical protein